MYLKYKISEILAKTAKLYKKGGALKSLGEKSCEIKGGSTVMMFMIILAFASTSLQPFMTTTFDFTTFSPEGYTLFIQLGCFCMDIIYITDTNKAVRMTKPTIARKSY